MRELVDVHFPKAERSHCCSLPIYDACGHRTRGRTGLRVCRVAAELEAHAACLGTPGVEQGVPVHISLRSTRPERRKLHAPRRSIAVLRGRRLNRLASLGKRPLDMARDGGNAEAIHGLLNRIAGALELAR